MPFSLYPNQLIVTHFFVHFIVRFLLTFVHFLYPFVIENIHFCTKISTFCTVHTLVRVNLEISSVFLFFAHSIILSYDFFSMFRFSVFLFFTNRYKGLKIFPFLIFSSLSSGWFWALEANMSSFYLSVFVFFSVPPFFSLLLPSLLTLSLPFCPLFYAYGDMCASFRERVVLSHNKCIKNALGRHQIRHSSHLYFSLFRKETFIKVNIGYYVGKKCAHQAKSSCI